jgi:hypothetical protein
MGNNDKAVRLGGAIEGLRQLLKVIWDTDVVTVTIKEGDSEISIERGEILPMGADLEEDEIDGEYNGIYGADGSDMDSQQYLTDLFNGWSNVPNHLKKRLKGDDDD